MTLINYKCFLIEYLTALSGWNFWLCCTAGWVLVRSVPCCTCSAPSMYRHTLAYASSVHQGKKLNSGGGQKKQDFKLLLPSLVNYSNWTSKVNEESYQALMPTLHIWQFLQTQNKHNAGSSQKIGENGMSICCSMSHMTDDRHWWSSLYKVPPNMIFILQLMFMFWNILSL